MMQLYRKDLLEKMSSPEQLDKAVVIVSPSFWLAILFGAITVVVALVWSFLGTLPEKVTINGVYVPEQTSVAVSSEVTGIVDGVKVKNGQEVKIGDTLYTLDTKNIVEEKEKLQKRLDIVNSVTLFSTDDVMNQDTSQLIQLKSQMGNIPKETDFTDKLLEVYKEQLKVKESQADKMYEKALEAYEVKAQLIDSIKFSDIAAQYGDAAPMAFSVAIEQMEASYRYRWADLDYTYYFGKYQTLANEQAQLENAIKNLQDMPKYNKYNNLTIDANTSVYATQFETTKASMVSQCEEQMLELDKQLVLCEVKAPANGVIANLSVINGAYLSQGSVALSVMQRFDDDVIMCYAPVSAGKSIETGMKVIVCPMNVNKDEYGHMEGEVVFVDPFVTSQSQILSEIADQSLAQAFANQGPVMAVKVKLQKDENTASGYYWSSKRAKDIIVYDGTMVSAEVITEDKKPITLLVPKLKEKFKKATTAKEEAK